MLVLDKWAGNADGRQVIFTKPATARKYSATFIDQGYCFNCSESGIFPILRSGVSYARNCVYQQVTGWESFEPVLSRAEQMDSTELWALTEGMPEEWWSRYGSQDDLSRLIETLYQRRSSIRDLITGIPQLHPQSLSELEGLDLPSN